MSNPLYDSRIGVIAINGVEIPTGSDNRATITRQPEMRFGAAIGNQPPPLEFVGNPQLEASIPVGALTVANKMLAAVAAECLANASISAGSAATLKDIVIRTADGFQFSGKGYVMMPTTLEMGTATPERTYMVMIPNATPSAAGVASALVNAGVIA